MRLDLSLDKPETEALRSDSHIHRCNALGMSQ
jgi:hypothetical protein